MSKKILPLCEPPISTYHYHADLLSIILNNELYKYPDSYDKNYNRSWLYNNYIQIEAPSINGVDDYKRLDYTFPNSHWKTCPFVYYQKLDRKFVDKNWNSIVDFIISSLDSNLYVYMDFDWFYLKNHHLYQKKHFIHDLFIYGYDLESKTIFIKEYLKNSKYSSGEISFEEFEKGYKFILEDNGKFIVNGIELLSPRIERYDFDIKLICDSINDYILSENRHNQFYSSDNFKYYKNKFKYGFDVYKNVFYYLKFELKLNNNFIDRRIFHIISGHKKVMLERIKIMGEKGYLLNCEEIFNAYEKVSKQAEILEAYNLKLEVKKDINLANKMVDMLENMINAEQDIFIRILNNCYIKPVDFIECHYPKYINQISVSKKVGESFILENHVPINSDETQKVTWEDNSDLIFIEINNDKTMIKILKSGTTIINGYNTNGDKVAECKVKTVKKEFNTNLVNLYPIFGDWTVDKNGLVGYGENKADLIRLGHYKDDLGSEVFLPENGFLITDSKASDFILKADICINSGRAASLVFRAAQDLKQLYCANIHTEGYINDDYIKGFVKIWKPVDNLPNDLCIKETEIKENTWYQIKIEAVGGNIKVYIDDKLLIEHFDSEFSDGYFGFNTYFSKTYFQNVYYTKK